MPHHTPAPDFGGLDNLAKWGYGHMNPRNILAEEAGPKATPMPLPDETFKVNPFNHSEYRDAVMYFRNYWKQQAETHKPVDVNQLISQGVDPSMAAQIAEQQSLDIPAMEQFKVSPYDRWLHGQGGPLPPTEIGTVNIHPGEIGKYHTNYPITLAEAEMLDGMGLLFDEKTKLPLYPVPTEYAQKLARERFKGLPAAAWGELIEHFDTVVGEGLGPILFGDPGWGQNPFGGEALNHNPKVIEMWKQYFAGKSDMNFDQMVNETSRLHEEERTLGEQLLLGLADPTLFASKIKAGVTAGTLAAGIMGPARRSKFFKDRKLNQYYDDMRTIRNKKSQSNREKLEKVQRRLREELTDRFAWTADAAKAARRIYEDEFGTELPAHMDAEIQFSLMGGRPSAILDESVEVAESALRILDGTPIEHLDNFLRLRHMQDTLRMHPDRVIPKSLKGPVVRSDLYDLTEQLLKMQNELGEETWGKIVNAADQYRSAIDNQLERMRLGGMIDGDLVKTLREKYPWYNPIRYVESDDVWKAHTQGRNIRNTDNGLRYLSEVGGDLATEAPSRLFFSYMARTDYMIHRNNAAKAFIDMIKTIPEYAGEVGEAARVKPVAYVEDTAQDLIDKVADTFKKGAKGKPIFRPVTGAGKNQIAYLAEGGKLKVFDVSEDAAAAFEMLQMLEPSLLSKTARAIQAVPRGSLVTYNPVFMTGQFLYDSMVISLMEGAIPGKSFVNLFKGARAVFREDLGLRRLIREGGDVSGFWGKTGEDVYRNMMKGERVPSLLSRGVQRLTGGRMQDGELVGGFSPSEVLRRRDERIGYLPIRTREHLLSLLNPLALPRIIKKLGHAAEMAPRRTVFEQELKRGRSVEHAAVQARRSTGDFNRAGNVVKAANAAYLFLNPAVQGFLIPFRAMGSSARYKKQARIAMAGYMGMQVASYGWNRQFPEYADLSMEDRHGHLGFMLPSNEVDEYGNKKPNMVSIIPTVREFGAWSSPLIYLLERLDRNPTVRGMLPEGMRSGAQVQDDFGMWLKGFGKMASPLSSIVTHGTWYPQAPLHYGQVFTELMMNTDTYYDREIVPADLASLPAREQHNEWTSQTAIELGDFLGWSPMWIDHSMRNGAVFELFAAADAALLYAKGGDPVIRSYASELAEMTERYEPEDIPIERRKFLSQFDAETRKKIEDAVERLIDPNIPFVTSVKNKFINKKGGNLWIGGQRIAERETGASYEQTRDLNVKLARHYEDIVYPIMYELDQKYNAYQADHNTTDDGTGISPYDWLNERRSAGKLNEAFMLGIHKDFSQAAQFMTPEDRLKWYELVYTVGGTFPLTGENARISRGQWNSLVLNTIPMYDAVTGEAETFPPQVGFNPDWYRFFKDQEEFLGGLSESDRNNMKDWDSSNDSVVVQKYKADKEIMKPYVMAKDVALDKLGTDLGGTELNEFSPREALRIYELKNPDDRQLLIRNDSRFTEYKFRGRNGNIFTGNIIKEIESITEKERDNLLNKRLIENGVDIGLDPDSHILELALLHWGILEKARSNEVSQLLLDTRVPLFTR